MAARRGRGQPEGRRGHWTLAAAREMLPDVRSRTEQARETYDPLQRRREALAAGSPERAEIEHRMRVCLSRWMREMEALRVVVRGPWRVEFLGEKACFPWEWPETDLLYVRSGEGEDDGAERMRIQ